MKKDISIGKTLANSFQFLITNFDKRLKEGLPAVIFITVAFNILNTHNRFVYSILELTHRLTDPFLNRIRRFLPNLGSLDISPIILLLLIWFIEICMKLYIAPLIF